jgi:CRISPR-associated protein Csd1
MAITYYRELTGSDFLDRIQNWHESVSWHQNYSKDVKFIGAPSPKDIAEAAYGQRIDDRLRKATVERLFPCIIDGVAIPQDLITSCHNRLCNRVGMDAWEWEKTLGITCALVRGSQKERSYKMALETDRTSRDYLYGRLLAIADYLEYCALDQNNKRPTSATRLMHQFSMHPYKTWKNIELSLTSYKPRIHSGLLIKLEKLIDDVMDKFSSEDFINPSPLSSEFLLAFHSQRKDLWKKSETKDKTENTTEELGA